MSKKEEEKETVEINDTAGNEKADSKWFFLKVTTWWKIGFWGLVFSVACTIGTYCGYTYYDKERKELVFQCAKEKANLEKDLIVSKDVQLLENGNEYLRQWRIYEENKHYIARMADLSNCDTLSWAKSKVDSLIFIYGCK